jgi:hypothetical protein
MISQVGNARVVSQLTCLEERGDPLPLRAIQEQRFGRHRPRVPDGWLSSIHAGNCERGLLFFVIGANL